MRVLFFIFFIFLAPVLLFAQDRQYSTTNRDAIKHFALANEELDNSNYDRALDELHLALHEDTNFIEAHSLLADLYRRRRQHTYAAEEYNKVLALIPEYN